MNESPEEARSRAIAWLHAFGYAPDYGCPICGRRAPVLQHHSCPPGTLQRREREDRRSWDESGPQEEPRTLERRLEEGFGLLGW